MTEEAASVEWIAGLQRNPGGAGKNPTQEPIPICERTYGRPAKRGRRAVLSRGASPGARSGDVPIFLDVGFMAGRWRLARVAPGANRDGPNCARPG